ncbi:RBBP9/YdeN family alpha/beta hydrolase [Alloalcanivorax mobilis]|uniref:RBBP9/YdeN family alpha/beta hydrolase n=1 Tax=Alloalcanivorax mobilis TaxID=2019569 RepID=UPI000C75B5F6|nr:alpha/beta fold hydrolase [Alloalcanivorax mobilis]
MAPVPFEGILIPGLYGSDEGHWQSLWQAHMPWLRRIELESWECADLDAWQDAIEHANHDLEEPAVLIAHSFGCIAAAAWVRRHPDRVAGLLLVAPAWPDADTRPGDRPDPLPVPARIIASTSDPWMDIDETRALARRWGAAFRNGGDLGHINTAAGVGEWRQGLDDLRWLLAQRSAPQALAG